MPALSLSPRALHAPLWLSVAAVGGVAWNLFGVAQFVGSTTATAESLLAAGLTPEQADVMMGYPGWMTFAFGIGVVSGLLGSVLLLFRHALAQPVLAASLLAYVALWVGDAIHGVFAAIGAPQIVIITFVVAVAAALFATSRHPDART
ncbi:hypothetical protein [Pseudoroseicyclus tamaricis]|uniref:Uncharacterized protein n=1 Tax=Pseudoroseicyclus tamaricis TaxID=2705421 RepID=A0A6B2JS52_9RHOB|nr:hypothetical protein [Pseudoroseicyclus tamaricis]NDV00820.1 hypothetical protein [Pseudoroseicyclus tamaricis]